MRHQPSALIHTARLGGAMMNSGEGDESVAFLPSPMDNEFSMTFTCHTIELAYLTMAIMTKAKIE